jgi:hypothetical protein
MKDAGGDLTVPGSKGAVSPSTQWSLAGELLDEMLERSKERRAAIFIGAWTEKRRQASWA